MKMIILSSLICLLVVSPVLGQEKPSSEVEVFYQNAMSQINVRHVNWIKNIAKEANEKNLTIDEIGSKAAVYTSSQGFSKNEMEFLIGLAATLTKGDQKKQIAQLQSALDSLKKQKGKIMDAIAGLEDKRKPVTAVLLDSVRHISEKSKLLLTQINSNKSEHVKVVNRDTIKVIKTKSLNKQVTQAAIDAQVFQLKNDFDSLSETGEKISLRLQMYMDRHSKYISTISNIFKKFSDTSSAIIQNLK